MTVSSPYADIDIPDVGLPEFLFSDLGEHAESVAIIDGPSGREGDVPGARRRRRPVRGGPGRAGTGKGDVIAMFAPNNPYYPVVFHGALAAGVAVTTLNSMYTPDEVAFQLRDSGAKLLVTISPFLDRARAALRAEGLAVTEVVLMDDARDEASTPMPENALADLLTTSAERPSVSITGDDVAALPYSSGTTGRAKGVVLTHRNLVANLLQFGAMGETHQRLEDPRRPAVLPHLRHDLHDEQRDLQARDRRDDAEVRPRGVPADHLRAPRRPRLHRPADRGGARQAPDGRAVRHRLRRRHLLRRRGPRRRPRPQGRQAPQLHRLPGLRDDRALAGQPRDARGPARHGPVVDRLRAARTSSASWSTRRRARRAPSAASSGSRART